MMLVSRYCVLMALHPWRWRWHSASCGNDALQSLSVQLVCALCVQLCTIASYRSPPYYIHLKESAVLYRSASYYIGSPPYYIGVRRPTGSQSTVYSGLCRDNVNDLGMDLGRNSIPKRQIV